MWTKVDDHLHSNLKVLEAWRENRGALGLHLLALSHAGQTECDGRISRAFVEEKLPKAAERRRLVGVLVSVGLWDELPGGDWQVHDYLEDNLSSEQIRDKKVSDRRRKALARRPSLLLVVHERDRGWCRYCGGELADGAGRNGDGQTFDLVDPDGRITRDNVVLACRRCVSRKGALSLEEAGMSLLPEPEKQLALAPVSARTSAARPLAPTRPDPTRPEGVVQR